MDEIATSIHRAAPDDIARLGFQIAYYLNPSLSPVVNADDTLLSNAKMIAAALHQAKRPVIISGISCYNEMLIRASFSIAAALTTIDRKAGLSYVLPECNSMGLAMMQAPSFDKAVARIEREENITAIILENDIYRYTSAAKADSFLSRCKNIVVLDSLNNRTTEKAHVLIPASTFAEADGTMVNNEGRAQRFYQVYMPSDSYINESWKWLGQIKVLQTKNSNGQEHHPDEVLAMLETAFPQFEGITQVAPPHDFRIHGELVPREPHRYSGRTALMAKINVSEPKPLQDDDSPFSFTMEGYKGIPPGSVAPFFWAPGWNSAQSVNKYQEEVGGSLRGVGNTGVSLFKRKTGVMPSIFKDMPEAFVARQHKWLLLPQHHVFGSDELSMYSKAIKELAPEPYLSLSGYDMQQLGVKEDAVVQIETDETGYSFPVKMKKELTNGIVLISAGLPGMEAMNWGSWVKVKPIPISPKGR